MNSAILSSDLNAAIEAHLDVLQQFTAIVEARLASCDSTFVRESLGDLLSSLRDQRDDYVLVVQGTKLAA